MTDSIRIEVSAERNVTRLVVEASRLARKVGMGDVARSQITTAISELARNILKYAGQGAVTVERVEDGTRVGLRVVAIDQGPGIPDLSLAMQDHYSTGGTLGLGLPGVRRLVDEFDVESSPDRGTTITVTKWRP